ncbi:DUF4214 domain-containing protein [Halomonas sp. THAF12]|uniref:DUF4214 domain-containing protein n=1 Tax=Halomonas sp. B23F22_10 TaxID=3459515 RepID=UPI00373E1212
MAHEAQYDNVQGLYIAYFGRPADPEGLDFWARQAVQDENGIGGIIQRFGDAAEFDQRYGDLSSQDLVLTFYQQLFGRDPRETGDQAGLDYWVGRLDGGHVEPMEVAFAILEGATGADVTVVEGKKEVAGYYSANVAQGDFDLDFSTALLAGIDGMATPADVEDAKIAVDTQALPEEFTELTIDPDTLVGDVDDDTFVATAGQDGVGEPANTLQSEDVLTGGDGDDALHATLVETGVTAAPTLNGIEHVQARFAAEGGATLDLSNANGVGSVGVVRSTAPGFVTNVGTIDRFSVANQDQTVGFESSAVTAFTLSIGNVTAQADGDLAVVDFDDIQARDITVDAHNATAALGLANITRDADGNPVTEASTLETLTVNATGDNTLGITGTGNTTTLNIAGDGNLTLVTGAVNSGPDVNPVDGLDLATEFTGGAFDALETLDASEAGGNISVTAGAALTSATLGDGDDSLSIDESHGDNAGAAIRGGGGDDTLSGGSGDDLIVGGSGDDTLMGGDGDDIFGGLGGDDIVTGGAGNDEFHFDAGTGTDEITDFDVDADVISFLDTDEGAIQFANSQTGDVRGDGDLAMADFQTRASLADTQAMDDQKVVMLEGDVTDDRLANDMGAAAEFYLVANSGGSAQIYYDDDWSDAAGREHVATLTGINTADLGVENFDVY